MARGKVKWFNDLKGYGFITSSDNLEDIYVHHTDIRADGYKTLRQGESVEYDLTTSPEGPKARNVVVVG
jgi:CspA family cold shock protein